MMLFMEGMDMTMGTPSCVWSILDPILENLVLWEATLEEEEEEEEDLDPQLGDLNSESWCLVGGRHDS